MAQILKKLKAKQVEHLKAPGRYNDGGGLYLYVHRSGHRYWIFRYRDRITGKLREKGLGPVRDTELGEARNLARDCRKMLLKEIDPIDATRQSRITAKLEKARQITFKDCADRYIESHRSSWRNTKHAAQWSSTLETYCAPLHALPVADIETAHILQCLEPIWLEKTETASRVRQRIESVLDWATAREYRTGENPARWRGHLNKLLPMPSKLKRVKHRPALDYRKVGDFMARLRKVDSLAAKALEFQILTAARPGEVVGAKWEEFDLTAKSWTIAADRMKANREHTIPLSPQAIVLLESLPHASDYVFPGRGMKKGLTTAAGMKLVKEIEPGITAHGFRSTFRDWAADQTSYAREVIEHALAHRLKDKAEAAYFRSDLMPKRARLMKEWANYCGLLETRNRDITQIRGTGH